MMRLRPRRGGRDLSKPRQVINVHYVSSSSHHYLLFLFRMSWHQKELEMFFKILIRDHLVARLVPSFSHCWVLSWPCGCDMQSGCSPAGHLGVGAAMALRTWKPLKVPWAPQIPHPPRGPQRSLPHLEWFPCLPPRSLTKGTYCVATTH